MIVSYIIKISVIFLLQIVIFFSLSSAKIADEDPVEFCNIIPNKQECHSEAYVLGRKLHITFIYKINIDPKNGNINIESISDDFHYIGKYDRYLKIRNTEFVYSNKTAIDKLGYDKRISYYDAQNNQLVVKYFLEDKEIRSKTVDWNKDLIDTENILIYLQAMLLADVDNFDCDLFLKDKGFKINVHLQLLAKDEMQRVLIKNNNYKYISDIYQNRDEFKIYQMNLNGVFRILYPVSFYFVYHKSSSMALTAYWGGEGDSEEFFWFGK